MSRVSSRLRLVWAMDPFEPIGLRHRRTVRFLKKTGLTRQGRIVPVTVQSLPLEHLKPATERWKRRFASVFEEALTERCRKMGLKGAAAPVVLFDDSPLAADRAETLISYSEESDSDLLIVTTREKIGINEVFGDSFAETLFYRSEAPVLTVGWGARPAKGPFRILFPTDFRARAHALFSNAVRIAAQLDAELILFHAIALKERGSSSEIVEFQEDLADAQDQQTPAKMRAKVQTQARRWVQQARAAGVQADFSIVETHQDVYQAILQTTRELGVSLVAMQDKSHGISENVIGSNTRQVVRGASCPVLVLKSGKRAKLLRTA